MPFSKSYLTPYWRPIASFAVQLSTIIALLAPSTIIQYTGKAVIIQTMPLNPYDALRGRYITLEYNISRFEALQKLPGWNELITKFPGTDPQYYPVAEGTNIYVILASEVKNRPWRPLRVTSTLPTKLSENQVALRGRSQYGSVVYGLEKYYMPEVTSDFSNQDIFQTRPIQLRQHPVWLRIKVDAQGNAVPVEMDIADTAAKSKIRKYRF
jgi:uncharacterized membrane-anchored protein